MGPQGSPHASRSRLGWIAWNVIHSGSSGGYVSNRADVMAIEHLEDTRNLEKLYQKSMLLDFPERVIDEKPEYSIEDRKFLSMMSNSKNVTDGHYEFCLPFKEPPNLPNNHSQALQRLSGLKKKFRSNSQFHEDYNKL